MIDEKGNSLWLGGCSDCLRLLDWIWEAFQLRLANRVDAAYYFAGLPEALGLCDDLAARFDLTRLDFGIRPLVGGMFLSGEPVPREPSLHYCDFDFNGYREEAWGRFVSAIDSAKQQARRLAMNRPSPESKRSQGFDGSDPHAPESNALLGYVINTGPDGAPGAAGESWTVDGVRLSRPAQIALVSRFKSTLARVYEQRAAKEIETEPDGRPTRPFKITGSSAPAYAEAFRTAVRRDPGLRWGKFAVLVRAAGVEYADDPVRTVVRAIKKATGWKPPPRDVDAFVTVLFVAVGEDLPTDDGI